LRPKEAGLFSNRGNAYRKKGDASRAIEDFDQALDLNPNLLFGYWNRGLAYEANGDRDKAVADLNKALSLNPDAATKKKIEASLQEVQQ
jgi:tetratricopeptide (TPR) repeat protein